MLFIFQVQTVQCKQKQECLLHVHVSLLCFFLFLNDGFHNIYVHQSTTNYVSNKIKLFYSYSTFGNS